MESVRPTEPRGEQRRAGRFFRADITGLRALAIIPVVAYHAGVSGFSGGFVGVDVFFVISGFLITGQLLRDRDKHGRVDFGLFWAKRLRRLVPAAALMILLTLPLVLLFLPPVDWMNIGKQAAAALVFVSNIFFSVQPNDYFTVDLANPQPYLHTWSLGVEEQFYLVWPLVIVAVFWIASRTRRRPRRALAVAFSVLAALSLGASIVLTPSHSQEAFYFLPTRAWEFALAGLVALLPAGFISSSRARTALGGAGIVGLLLIVFLLPSDTPYPGWAALLPVLATLAIILGGMGPIGRRRSIPTLVLEARPLTWIGTVSYSWYLWHWPLIVLLPLAFRSESPWIPIAAGAAAFGIGALTYYFFENPVRFSPMLTTSVKRSFIAAGALSLVVGVIASGTYIQGRSANVAEQELAAAAPPLPSDACVENSTSRSGVPVCVLGDASSKDVVMVIGDSHAGHWQAALGEAAKQEKVRLVYRWDEACPAIPVPTVMTTGVVRAGCQEYRDDTETLMADLRPKAAVISQAEAYKGRILSPTGTSLSGSQQEAAWSAAYDKWIVTTSQYTNEIAAFRDNPRLHFSPNICLAAPGGTARSCAPDRADALDQIEALQKLSAQVQLEHDVAPIFTTTDKLCDYEKCAVAVQGTHVYRDYNHLSPAYTASLVPELGGFLRQTVDRADYLADSDG